MYLITGASEGIGYATARALLNRTESPVMITGRSEAKLAAARKRLPDEQKQRLFPFRCDHSCREDVDALVDLIAQRGDIAGAVLGVGVNPAWQDGARRLHLVAPTTVEETIRTNCTHTMLVTAALLALFRRQRRGTLVWIGSRAQAEGLPGTSVYCATKSFLCGLARCAHNEYAGRGIRVHVAHPGIVRTPRTAATADTFAHRHGLTVSEPDRIGSDLADLVLRASDAGVEVDL